MPVFLNEEEKQLAKVGPGTPSGEVFRRYWLPVEVSANLGGGGGFLGHNNPLRIHVLGEDLVLFPMGAASRVFSRSTAATAALRCSMAAWRRTASAAYITAGPTIATAE